MAGDKRRKQRSLGVSICLRACYAVSGTDVAYTAMHLPGTDRVHAAMPYVATRCPAVSGTEIAYGATRRDGGIPVAPYAARYRATRVLRDVRC
eukprot:2803247-Rhodomonas_salina.1